jgi:hypothetical protein
MTGRPAEPRERRRFVLTVPVLDFSALERGAGARAEIRRLAGEFQLDPAHGVRLRMTGPVALGDEQFATLREGALKSTILSVVLVCALLFAALRSVKLVGAILAPGGRTVTSVLRVVGGVAEVIPPGATTAPGALPKGSEASQRNAISPAPASSRLRPSRTESIATFCDAPPVMVCPSGPVISTFHDTSQRARLT